MRIHSFILSLILIPLGSSIDAPGAINEALGRGIQELTKKPILPKSTEIICKRGLLSCLPGFQKPTVISGAKNAADEIYKNALRHPLDSEYENAFIRAPYKYTADQIARVQRQKVRSLGKISDEASISLPTTIRLNDHEYSITKMLGSGSFGVAYDAIDASGETVVIKILRNRMPEDVNSFKHEQWALEKTGNLIDSSSLLLATVQKKYEGKSLYDALGTMSNQEINAVRDKYMKLSKEFYEHHGFLHGDIAPRNVIISPDGSLHLIDYGMIRKIPSTANAENYLTHESYEAYHEFELILRAWEYEKVKSDLTTWKALSAIENYVDELITTGREPSRKILRDLKKAKLYTRYPWLKHII